MAIGGIGGSGNIPASSRIARQNPASGLSGVPAPEFGPDRMYTKTTQVRSDAEIRKDLVTLAKKDAARGVNGFGDDFGRSSKEYRQLAYEYITPYSPDRKSIFAKRLAEISDGLQSGPRTARIDNSVMESMLKTNRDILAGQERQGSAKSAALAKLIRKYDGDLGGNTITGEVSMIKFKEGGTDVGSWSRTYGWGYSPTGAEIARRGEAAQLYLQTWKEAMGYK